MTVVPDEPAGAGDDVAGTSRMSAGTPRSAAARAVVPWLPLIGLALLGAVLGYLAKYPCRFGEGWVNGTQFQYGCYSDVFPLYFRDELDTGVVPYLDRAVEYPVLTGALMYLLAGAVSWLPDPMARGLGYFDATAVVLGICLAAGVLGVGYLAGRRGGGAFDRRAALAAGAFVALTPPALLTAFINWDLLAVALATGGLAAHARGRHGWAGVLIGLAVAAKFYPLLFLGPLLVLAVRDLVRDRDTGGLRAFGRTLGAAVLAWAVVNAPVAVAAPEGWATFFRFSQERGADWGSVYYLLGMAGLMPSGDLDLLNRVGTGVLLLACVGVALLGVFARRRPPVEQLVFLVVAAFLITNKVWSPQFVLWLLPLAALAWPRAVPPLPALVVFGLWQLAEIGYVLGVWQYLLFVTQPDGATAPGIEAGTYAVLSLGRLSTLVMMCALIVVDCRRSGHFRP
ncbi:glycosyltransferase family 87 protein [Marinactinospora rubrisoli]|uniref:Glycosyltransferase family 87 protein n=1 Tax=Marinactinospora rubrisoli TaxID=2715399 RepID=A0ABW2KFB1_9ACTN